MGVKRCGRWRLKKYECGLKGDKIRVVRREGGKDGEKREVRKKNSFFKYYNIKFFESQEG